MGNGFKEKARIRETKEQRDNYNKFYTNVFRNQKKTKQLIVPKKDINGAYLTKYVEFLH